jgi:uncharacterized GH25 family protein
MKKTTILNVIASIAVLSVCTLFAHDMWLVPTKYHIQPGESLVISTNTGMDFPKSLSAVTPDRLSLFKIVGKSDQKNLQDFKTVGNSLTTQINLKEVGTYVIAMALKQKEIKLTAKEFNEYLLSDGITSIYELRKKEGILDKDAVEYYSKFAKTLVQVGDSLDNTAIRPLGLLIEIVPAENPYSLKKGDELEVKVLYRGEPLPQAELFWSYPGMGEEFAGSTITDASGDAMVPLQKSGPYVIRMTYMEWVKMLTHEWESYWASLTFEVK